MDRSTDSGRMRHGDDRGFIDRAEDEVRSWFGDDDAESRRERDRAMDGGDDRSHSRGGDYRNRSVSRGDSRNRGDYGPRGDDGTRSSFRGYDGPEAERYRRNYEVGDEADRRAREGYSSGRFFYETSDLGRSGRDSDGTRASDSGSRGSDVSGSRRSSGMAYRGEDRDMGSGMSRSSHAGRGPSGYSRSSDRITEDVSEALMDDHDVDATNVQVSVADGEVTLEGTVNSRDQKRRAEAVAERCRGVHDVHNRLRVSRDSGSMSPGGGVSGTMSAGGTGPQGSGAMVSGSSGGSMGAATQTSGASSMGSGTAGSGMGTAPDMAGGTATPGAAMDDPAGSTAAK